MTRYIYEFGPGKTDGDASMKNLLGGKGANLAEMARLGLPVPPGFTISTECCNDYFDLGWRFPDTLESEIRTAMGHVETQMKMKFGDPEAPLLVSCRSGARSSMPGMMETILNVGLCSTTIPGLVEKTGNEWFVYDAYRRLIMMYSDVVMEKADQVVPEDGMGIRLNLEMMMNNLKNDKGYEHDTDISLQDMQALCDRFKKKISQYLKKEFPDDPWEQLMGAIGAVFKSWNGKRAVSYRRIEHIPDAWGTAVNVQAMVFGNMGDTSATGVAFTRDPSTGKNHFFGEWLVNAQGEDVVAGIRTPNPLNKDTKNMQNQHLPSLEEAMPGLYDQLYDIRNTLESHYKDMQDIEFTIQEGTLYMLQCRVGKRTATAALNMAMDMYEQGMIDEKTMICRLNPKSLDEMLHPIVDPREEKTAVQVAEGLPAGPGGAWGKIVFTAEDAVQMAKIGENVILVREETSPEDIEGMRAASAILTARGGMTSHAALVARGWGKCCIVGAGAMKINAKNRQVQVGTRVFNEGDVFTLNGTKGIVYDGRLKMKDALENPKFKKFMAIADQHRTMGVRTNADTPEDAATALKFGAQGIGLFRTEHMFYGADSDRPLFLLRKMILSKSTEERQASLDELFPFVKQEIKNTLEVMDNLPVTLRLLDPPLHEFVPESEANQMEIAKALGIDLEEVNKRSRLLKESNPMIGHRGVRLGITFPEITQMQVNAIFTAAAELIVSGNQPLPEIMVPVTCNEKELTFVKKIVDDSYHNVLKAHNLEQIPYLFGTMIEIPRAALIADKMAKDAQFFSFGTNDLTQMTFGFSRDDIGSFMNDYIDHAILDSDPFETLDQEAVGSLIDIAVERGRKTRPEIKLGICGEHGGDPASVTFCHKAGLTYVSCSPYRVPIARLAAAQAAIQEND
ncbi:pyruvate, phosphate dikinase [Desulfotignum phosphitoxidans]|uniref:Pyruvate, phosphate dikinase n=1 Tax=Desulfotignum phosphitoxidans DSM 13687 TaxID=1286635 RepID=S0FX80_9BACT|nr:pyruvate, phosphate dikinase [Desulfotignum phosphitoxidans]EMS79335.1 pyruvate, phosphate dikinase PpdK [Desulfotignum phosphitoxidans DSM 13687]